MDNAAVRAISLLGVFRSRGLKNIICAEDRVATPGSCDIRLFKKGPGALSELVAQTKEPGAKQIGSANVITILFILNGNPIGKFVLYAKTGGEACF